MICHFGDKSFHQLIALVLTTKNKETEHYVHHKHKRQTEEDVLPKGTY